MLILSRTEGELINIGDDITVMVVETSGNRTRLGVKAPKEMPVHRGEVYQAIHESEPVVMHEGPQYLYLSVESDDLLGLLMDLARVKSYATIGGDCEKESIVLRFRYPGAAAWAAEKLEEHGYTVARGDELKA